MLPMLQTEPVVFATAGTSAAATAAGAHGGPLAPVGDLDDSASLFCEADVGFDSFHIPGIGSCELQLGDSWGGMQSKMSAVATVNKARKKSDTKPQAQINKCNNEKRRRELENETINQLEELLGACLSDVKQPDKNGIVQEAAAQIRLVLERRRECAGACCGACPPTCRLHCPATPVQAGEVTSTQPRADRDHLDYYSDIATLIEALKHYTSSLGWVLLEINSDGDIECVTENIKDIIAWDRSELYKQSIYTYLHHSDHQNLAPILQNVQAIGWPSVDADKFHAIRSRLLIKGETPDEPTGYVEVLIHAAAVRGACEVGAEEGASVMCVVRRCEDASPGPLAFESGPPAFAHKQPPQITFKLDRTSKIITCDLTGVGSASGLPQCRALEGVRLIDLVDPTDRVQVIAHLRDSPQAPSEPTISAPFRLRVGHNKAYVTVRSESRLFRNPTSQEGDFVMSTHSILSEEEAAALGGSPVTPPVGGPLMTSVANGGTSRDLRIRAVSPIDRAPFNMGDFDLDFQQPAWDYSVPTRSPAETYGAFPFEDMPSEDDKDKTAREIRSGSIGASEEPNRLRSLLSKKPDSGEGSSGGICNTVSANNRILKDLLKQEDEECVGSDHTSAPHTPHTPHTPATPAAATLSPQAPLPSRVPPPASTPTTASAAQHNHNNSDMLLRILNEKSDDDNEESRHRDVNRNASQPSALLTQLLANGPEGGSRPARAPHEGTDGFLDRFVPGKRKGDDARPGHPGAPKRATPEAQQQVSSTAVPSTNATVSVNTPTSSGMSALCQKNQILVSLLARQQSTPTTPLPSPNPNLRHFPNGRPRLVQPPAPPSAPPSARPHHHSTLTNMLCRTTSVNGGTTCSGSMDTLATSGVQSHLQMVLQGNRAYPGQAYPPPIHQYHFRPDLQNSLVARVRSVVGPMVDGDTPNDQMLSDLLDDVINELEPRQPGDMHLFNLQGRTDYTGMKEMDRINAITQSLMQVENTVKNPSPGVSPAYSAHSPQGQMYVSGRAGSGSSEPPPLGVAGGTGTRARLLAEQHRTRLLHEQRKQSMLVPQGAEQAPGDLNNTIEALVNSSTPPNVALTRTDYHHIYHPSSQMRSTYGTNKITSQQQQQNPMLSAQLTNPYSQVQQNAVVMHGGHPHSPHTPHTPLSPLPHAPLAPQASYHQRPTRPHHMGGFYADGGVAGAALAGGGYCVDYTRRANPPPHHHDHALSCGAGGSGASEYVRQEIRAVVGARARPEHHPHQLPHPPDLETLGLSFELPSPGGGSVVGGRGTSGTTNSWESHQSTPTTTAAGATEGAAPGADEAAAGAAPGAAATKASLLQKLLSE